MKAPNQTIQVVGAVITHQGRILAAYRRARPHQAAGWEFPGGQIEVGETPQAALAREIREELDIAIMVGDLVMRATTPLPTGAVDLACYLATPLDVLPTCSQDHGELRWLLPRELSSLSWLAPDLPAVRTLNAWGYAGLAHIGGASLDNRWHRVKPIEAEPAER